MHAGCFLPPPRTLLRAPVRLATRSRAHAHTRCCRPLLCAQGYRMRSENYDEARNNPDHDGGIRTAVNAWSMDPAAAKARYGPIASWDTSDITNMWRLFAYKKDFNEDISRWNVSNVGNMSCMFAGATSFDGDLSSWNVSNVVDMSSMFNGATSYNGDLLCWNVSNVESMHLMFSAATSFERQLGGAWATSTAHQCCMFRNSPGTIAGMTKDANGSIE